MFKKILSLFLCIIMLVPMISATGLTVTAATYSGTCGDNLKWTLDTATGVLTITGTGDMYDYDGENYKGSYRTTAPWKGYISYIKSVTIGDSVTSIGERAFLGCGSLKSVTIGDSVISIGHQAFCYTSLVSTTIPDSVTSIGDQAFRYCYSLVSITIGDSVTSIGDSAFNDCKSLTSVIISDSVTSIGFAAFDGCTSLASVTIGDSVTSIGNQAFCDCYSLASVTIGDSVTSIGALAFADCDSLTSVTIPDSVTNIGGSAFAYCDSLTSVTIGNSVASIGNEAFANCDSLVSIIVDENNEYYSNDEYGVLYDKDKTTLIQYIGNTRTSYIIPGFVTSIGNCAFAYCNTLVRVIILDSVTSIGDYAFYYCDSLASVTIGDSVTSIGDYAFYYCTSLASITIPDSVTSIGDYAFKYYNGGITIKCYENSYAHTYAVNNGFKYELMVCEHIFTNYISDNNATCTVDGTKAAYCDNGCGAVDTIVDENTAMGHSFTVYTDTAATCTDDVYRTAYCDNGCGVIDTIVDVGTALGHSWSEWITAIEPTYTTEGERIRFCFVCDAGESETLPVVENPNKPVIIVDNFTVTITNADSIKDMRYAPGVYTTTGEIRNAEGNVALDNGVISANTVDGNFVYEMPNGGIYSIWIRMKDGTNYILPLDVTKVTPSLTAYGVKITLHDLFDVKDFYIAKGEYQTYREIKDNGYITSVTSAKIGNKHDYTYTVYEPGVHTILVRYNDGRIVIFHEELTVDEPTFVTNGLQVTIGNIPDVKVIRTAYGEYNTPGDIKRASGARNFSGKSVIKGAQEYMIQYRENGVVSIAVEYNNGYVRIFHYDVKMKQANCTQTGSTVLLRNIDDFVTIRYAAGEYTTSAQIKRANGAKTLKPADVTGSYAIISGLAKGTYTFCVQFDDESYNYFKVTIG